MGNEGALTLEPFNFELKLVLSFMVAVVPLDFGVQSPVIKLLGVSHQIVESFRGTHKESVVPYR